MIFLSACKDDDDDDEEEEREKNHIALQSYAHNTSSTTIWRLIEITKLACEQSPNKRREEKKTISDHKASIQYFFYFLCVFFYIFMVGYKNKYAEKCVQINRDIKCMYELNGCLEYLVQYALSKIGSNVNFL